MFEGLMKVTRSSETIRVVDIGLFVVTNTMNNIDIDIIPMLIERLKTKGMIVLAVLCRRSLFLSHLEYDR